MQYVAKKPDTKECILYCQIYIKWNAVKLVFRLKVRGWKWSHLKGICNWEYGGLCFYLHAGYLVVLNL